MIALLLSCAGYSFGSAPADTVKQDTLVGDKLHYLELRGTIRHLKGENRDEAHILDSAVICVYNEKNTLVARYLTNRKGRCNFKLPLNRKFVVEVSKDGFVSKKVEINTKVPPEKKLAYIFPFSLDIFEEVKGLNVSVLEKPIARISYHFAITQFDYDNVYTTKINLELKKMYKEYYALQKSASDSAAAAALKPLPVDSASVPAPIPAPDKKKKKGH